MNKIKDAFSKIKTSDEFKTELIKNLQTHPKELKPTWQKIYYRPMIAVASIVLVIIGIISFKATINTDKSKIIVSANTVNIAKIELPKSNGGKTGKMMPLIVYKQRIYTLASTVPGSQNAKNLLGEKLGITTSSIDEWSKQTDYSTEFASTIGEQEVYEVKGYDKAFRIMTNTKNEDGTSYAQFYECLNGVTIKNGSDVFGKLKLKGNISEAKFRSFSDFNNGVENFSQIKDSALLNNFVIEMDKSTPYLLQNIETEIGDYQNDEEYKEITLTLKDGSKVPLSVLKSGYVYYGSPKVLFKIDDKTFKQLWKELSITKSSSEKTSTTILSNLMQLAKDGKVINCDFAAKTNVLEDVTKKWGEAYKTEWISSAKGLYATYSKYNMVFGSNKGSQIFEVRSFDNKIKNISLSEVKEEFGTPSYDVKVGGEEIIGYIAGTEFKLLLVFPMPTSKNENPLMDHYSVLYPRGTVNSMADDPGRQW